MKPRVYKNGGICSRCKRHTYDGTSFTIPPKRLCGTCSSETQRARAAEAQAATLKRVLQTIAKRAMECDPECEKCEGTGEYMTYTGDGMVDCECREVIDPNLLKLVKQGLVDGDKPSWQDWVAPQVHLNALIQLRDLATQVEAFISADGSMNQEGMSRELLKTIGLLTRLAPELL